MSVLVVGSVGIDTIETPQGRAEDVLGGSAVYFAAAASLFSPVRMVSVVGEDFPDEMRGALQEKGVDLAGVRVRPGRTFRWHGRYSEDMNDRETVSVELGVLEGFQPRLPPSYKDTPLVFLANGPTATQAAVRDQLSRDSFVAADTMNLWIETERDALEKLIGRVDMLVLNDSEARQLTGRGNLWEAAEALLERGPRTVVVKRGEHGCMLAGRGGPMAIPAARLPCLVDPTGAGDSFAGALLGSLASHGGAGGETGPEKGQLRRGLAAATAVASFTCESFGPDRLFRLTREDVERRLGEIRELVRF